MLHRHPTTSASLAGREAAERFFAALFNELDPASESLFVAHLDDRAQCIHLSRYDGDGTGATFPLRTILIDAATHDSKGIVLAHNHPSGDATPSLSDRSITRRMAQAGEAMDLTVVDHLVFAGGGCTSFRQMGLL